MYLAENTTIEFEPLEEWGEPGQKARRGGMFRTSLEDSLELICSELTLLKVKRAVLELGFTRSTLRRRGVPNEFAEASSPRVRLSFKHPTLGNLQYPCDTYRAWKHNVRAIALTLGAQRAMERYGASTKGQQYRGWQQLPPPEQARPEREGPTTVEEAAELVAELSGNTGEAGVALRNEKMYRFMFKDAVKRSHPDLGGQASDFRALQIAKGMLEKHFQML